MKKILLITWGLILLLMSMPISTASATSNPCVFGIGDQSNGGSSYFNISYYQGLTQIFIAPYTTELTKLELNFYGYNGTAFVDVDDLSLGTTIAQTSNFVSFTSLTSWETINFTTPVSLEAGKKYAIKVYNNLSEEIMLGVSPKSYMLGDFFAGSGDFLGTVEMRLKLYMTKGDPSRATANLSELLVADSVRSIETDSINRKYQVIVLPTATSLTLTPNLETPADSFLTVDGVTWQSGTPYTRTVDEGVQSIVFTVTKGDCSGSQSYTVDVIKDTTPPTITGTVSPQPNANGWNNGDVNLQWIVADSASGINPTTIPSSQIIKAEGEHSITRTVKDKAGNSASNTVIIKIDRTVPTISGTATSQPNADGWYKGDVTIKWLANDALSGIVVQPNDSVITGEGDNLSATATVNDRADNQASATVDGIKIDRTAPVTAIATADGTTSITLTATDTLSGVKNTFYQIDNEPITIGNTVDFQKDGSYSLKVWSEDMAGNVEQAQSIQVDIDQSAPNFVMDYPKKGAIQRESAEILVKFDEAGKVYYLLTDDKTVPDVAQVKASAHITVAANTEEKIHLTGLKEATAYTLYMVTEDSKGNLSQNVASLTFQTASPAPIAVESIRLNSTEHTLQEGDKGFALQATITPANATNQQITWGSSNERVAKVNENGFVTPIAAGEAMIQATTVEGHKTALAKIIVKRNTPSFVSGGASPSIPVKEIELNFSSYTFKESDAGILLKATITPSNATNQQLKWHSSDEKIVTVDQNGFMTPIAAGEAMIHVTTMDGSKTVSVKVTVLPKSSVPAPTPEEPKQPDKQVSFTDTANSWAKEMIEELAAQGIIQGYEDGTFRPNALISRMHVAMLLTRAFSLETVRNAEDFSDVPKNHRYYEAIKVLQQAGIIDGANGASHPTENMTRAQLAKVLVGVLGLTPQGTSSFKDVDSKHWSTGYIAVLEREGIALGDAGKFNPNEPVTRAQFVAFLYRIMQK